MGKEKGIRLSQCMIVRDEERNIERALSWARGLAWEQIVVDTGSRDGTVSLARSLGAKVISREWRDDFAGAKNFAISQAKGDWIAFLDADEYLDSESARTLSLLLEQIGDREFDGISSAWEQVGEDGRIFAHGTQVRFFRRDPRIRYEGRIHEQLIRLDGRPLRLADVSGQIRILHTGYQPREKEEKGKNERNRRILAEELKKRPEDPALMGYMGDAYRDEGREGAREAFSWYQRALSHMPCPVPDGDGRAAATLTYLLELGAGFLDGEAFDRLYARAAERAPKEPDLDYVMGLSRAGREDWEGACRFLGEAFRKLAAFGTTNRAMRLAAQRQEALGLYVKCLWRAGNRAETLSRGREFLQAQPWDMSVLSVYMQALAPAGEALAVEELYGIYSRRDAKSRLFLYRCAFSSGIAGLTGALWETLEPPEREALGRRGMGPENVCERREL